MSYRRSIKPSIFWDGRTDLRTDGGPYKRTDCRTDNLTTHFLRPHDNEAYDTPTQSILCSTRKKTSFGFDYFCVKHAKFVNIGKTLKNKEQAWQQVAIDLLTYILEK